MDEGGSSLVPDEGAREGFFWVQRAPPMAAQKMAGNGPDGGQFDAAVGSVDLSNGDFLGETEEGVVDSAAVSNALRNELQSHAAEAGILVEFP